MLSGVFCCSSFLKRSMNAPSLRRFILHLERLINRRVRVCVHRSYRPNTAGTHCLQPYSPVNLRRPPKQERRLWILCRKSGGLEEMCKLQTCTRLKVRNVFFPCPKWRWSAADCISKHFSPEVQKNTCVCLLLCSLHCPSRYHKCTVSATRRYANG